VTSRLVCGCGHVVERFKVNMPFTAFICVAQKYGVKCPKRVYAFEFDKDCLIDCANNGLTDFEVYKQ